MHDVSKGARVHVFDAVK